MLLTESPSLRQDERDMSRESLSLESRRSSVAEQLIRNQWVGGSNPLAGSILAPAGGPRGAYERDSLSRAGFPRGRFL